MRRDDEHDDGEPFMSSSQTKSELQFRSSAEMMIRALDAKCESLGECSYPWGTESITMGISLSIFYPLDIQS